MNKILFELVEKSTETVEKENWKHYYQIGDYKFNNVYLANWFEKETNSWAAFVAQQTPKIKQKLKNKKIDVNYNYDLDFLKKLSETQNFRFFFSGGSDSLSILDIASKNNITINEIVSVATGDNINKTENYEIVNLALEEIKNYKNFKTHTVIQHSRNLEKHLYKDPYIFYKLPDVGSEFPMFRRMWNFDYFNDSRLNVFGPTKPELLYYNNSWYCVCFDHSLSGTYALNNTVYFNMDADNIYSYIKESLQYREYILKNNLFKKEKFNFYKLSSDAFDAIDRVQPKNVNHSLKKVSQGVNEIWSEKDLCAISDTLNSQDLELLLDYFFCIKTLISTQPYVDLKNKKLANSKFCWAIDIDTLEVFTQQELLPNGFE